MKQVKKATVFIQQHIDGLSANLVKWTETVDLIARLSVTFDKLVSDIFKRTSLGAAIAKFEKRFSDSFAQLLAVAKCDSGFPFCSLLKLTGHA